MRKRSRTVRDSLRDWKKRTIPPWVTKLDRFGFSPTPRSKLGEQHSFRGALFSAVVIILVLVNVVYTTIRFFEDTPSISTTTIPTDAAPMEFIPSAIVFRINDDRQVPKVPFYDPSYFTYTFTQTTAYHQDEDPRTNVDLGAEACDVSSWAGWTGTHAWCPKRVPEVLGRYQSDSWQFYRIDVRLCVNRTDNSSSIVCQPKEIVTDLIARGRFNVLLRQPEFEKPAVFEANNYFINPDFWTLYELVYRSHTVDLGPNLLSRFTSKVETFLSPAYEKYYSYRFYGIYLTVFARLDSQATTETRSVSTVLDLIGSWFALYGAVHAVFALHMQKYNEEKFYKKNPKWDNLNRNFRHDESDPESTESKQQKSNGGGNDELETIARPLVEYTPVDCDSSHQSTELEERLIIANNNSNN